MKFRFLLVALALLIGSVSSYGQIAIPNSTPVTQNFDAIGATATAALPTNWKMTPAGNSAPTWANAGNFTTTTVQASSGLPVAGGRYNWGNGTTTTDRAIGFMTSGGYANPNSIMAYYQNTSGTQINDLTIAFDYERYRINSANCAITFFTSTDGSTWTARTAGDSGAFATGTNTYDFTTGTVVSKSFTLTGVNIANGSNLYLRWNFNTTGGNSQGVGLDNVNVSATLAPIVPTITTSVSSLSGFTYGEGSGPSQQLSYTVSGLALTNNIVITAPTNYEISTTSGSGFTSSIALVPTSGVVNTTTIYVRLKSGLVTNTYAETITNTSVGATQSDVACNGIVTNVVNYASLNTNSGTIFFGQTYAVAAECWEPGITDAAGNGGVLCWIGYSSNSANPTTGTWTWVAAAYTNDSGNNDVFSVNLGGAIPATGTYNFVSRFQIGTGAFVYGGFTSGFWNGTTIIAPVLTVNPYLVDWANLQSPASATILEGSTFMTYGQVFEPGVTNISTAQGTGITVDFGISPVNSNTSPNTWTNWTTASYNNSCAFCGDSDLDGIPDNDEYFVTTGSALPAGTYYYTFRYSLNGGPFLYGGYNAGGGGFWNNTTDVSGVLTVTTLATIVTSAITGSPFCVGNDVTAAVNVPFTITGTFTAGNVFTAQLSDATGSFTSPTTIGTLTQTNAGTIAATIPSGIAAGTGYRIRVIGSTPATVGTNNGTNLTITNFAAPTAFTAICGNAISTSSWVNPGCFSQVMVVATATAFTSALPSGDGTAYTANLAFGLGTGFDGGFVVYKGTATASGTITNLTNGTPYTFKIYVRSGTTWLAGGTQTCLPLSICGSESFVNLNAPTNSTYASGSYTGDNGVTWTYIESKNDPLYQITGSSIMLRQLSSGSKVTSSSVSGGLGNFTCKLLKGFTSGSDRQVELFVNGVSYGTSIAWNNTSVQTFSVPNINIGGNVIVEIRNSTGNQVVVDDISWTCYTPPACITPAAPGAITFGTVNTNSIAGTFEASVSATADNYFVIASTSATLSAAPVTGTTYAIGASLGGGTVVDNDTNTSFSATTLQGGTQYYFFVYAFDAGCIGGPQYSATNTTATTTTNPNVPTGLTKGCPINNNSLVLSWTAPAIAYDGYLLVVREAAVPHAVTSIVASSQAFNLDYSLAPTYNTTTSRVLYIGSSTSATVTGLTSGVSYTFALYAYKNNGASTLYSTATTTTQLMVIPNVSSVYSMLGDAVATIGWTNPSACFQGIMAVVTTGSGTTFVPSGNGSLYTANASYSAANQVVYNGTGNTVLITGLTNGVTYYVEIFVWNGSQWSLGVEISVKPNPPTVFNAGELLFVGYDGQVNGGGLEDEYLVATMVDINPGTQFSIVNSRYEAGAAANIRTDKWGGGGDLAEQPPFVALITYNGSLPIQAGAVLAIKTDGSTNWFGTVDVITGTTTTTRTPDFLGVMPFGSGFVPNISTSDPDQIFLVQGSFASDGSIDEGQANYTLTGTLLHGLTNRVAWVSLTNACSGAVTGGETRQSRLPAALTCFNVESISATAVSGFYQNDKEHGLASIRQIINAVANVPANWTLSSTRYTKDPTSSSVTRAAKTFQIGPSNLAGSWVGDVSGDNTNWFNCGNWEGLKVPDATTDVFLNGTSLSDAVIDYTAAYSDYYQDIAKCKDLNITNRKVLIKGSINNVLEAYGNLDISATGGLDMDDNNTGTTDGIIKFTGNWTNSIGNAAFSEGNGTVQFNGITPQIINNVTPEGTETFYNVLLNNNFDTGVSNDLIATGNLTVSTGKLLTIKSNDYVQVNKNLVSNGTVNVENNGSLVQVDDDGVDTGSINLQRIAQVRNQDYVYWSSPVAETLVSSLPTNNRYEWGTTSLNANGTQGNWIAPTTLTMTKGKGYIARASNGASTAQPLLKLFTGLPFNGLFNFPITRGSNVSSLNDNWNLIGNPYPSAISAISFLQQNAGMLDPDATIEGAVRLWMHGILPSNLEPNPFYQNFANNYSPNDYVAYNSTGSSCGSCFNGFIASGQGFFVVMKDGAADTQSVVFKNNMRNRTHNNSNFFRTAEQKSINLTEQEKHRIWLDLIDATGASIRTLVGYVPGATLAKDNMFDAYTKVGASQNFYSIIANEVMTIQGRPAPFDNTDVVPLGIKVNTSGNYTIAIATTDGLFEGANQNIYLEDTSLNIIHDLRQAPYIFTTAAGRNDTRFKLRYTNTTALGTGDFETLNNSVVVSTPGNNQIALQSTIEYMKSVVVYDILGRIVYNNDSVNAGQLQISDVVLNQQALIVKITLENGQVVTRKIVF